MKGDGFMPILCVMTCGIFGYASTDTQLSHPTYLPSTTLELSPNQRDPKHLQQPQNIYSSKNFIKSKLPQNNGQPQLFNLGYSVRFENQQNQNLQRAFDQTSFAHIEHGDIITGTRKQNVEIDIPGSSKEDNQFGYRREVKKRKLIGSKAAAPALNSEISYLESTGQTYVSPTTQKSLEALGKIRDVDNQEDLSELYQQKYTWRDLSPNVKIIRSTEIPMERIENRALNFDHQKALSKSEGFGFSDAIRDEIFEKSSYARKEPTFKRAETVPSTSAPEGFRIIHVQEQINEPPTKTKIPDPEPYTTNKNLEKENVFQVINKVPQIQTQTQLVKLPFLQTVNQQFQPEIINTQIPKQGYIQHIMMPQIQFESTPKYRTKHKYVKHIAGTRGNIVYARKVAPNLDYTRKAKIKPELRREFKPPPPGGQI
ncbi:uncharacterized protein LOC123309845 [Coccinella septempunctata]|uniref:uncharacterized protein LOC123309845 n=1 Tax=Coccinella septempunctata TaxID=41139 RepID=UPI001D06CDE1|nr:uncharacterized protein LOC123309845 [Coccinella septempunctata]